MTSVAGIVCDRYPQLWVKATHIHHYSPRLFTFPAVCQKSPQTTPYLMLHSNQAAQHSFLLFP